MTLNHHKMTGEILPGTLQDAEQLAALHDASFPKQGAWDASQLRGSLALASSFSFIARTPDGRITGFILCQDSEKGQAEILTLAVHPDCQRQGIASRLLAKVLDGFITVLLDVAEDNQAARTLYAKHGFTEASRRPRYYRRGAEAVDALLLTYRRSPAQKE